MYFTVFPQKERGACGRKYLYLAPSYRRSSATSSFCHRRIDLTVLQGAERRPSTRTEREAPEVADTHTGKVESTKVDPCTDELGQSTKLARYARNGYDGDNYAAGRYIDPDGRGESILVGYRKNSLRSERSIGYPLLHNDKQDGLKEVFTEREPCQKRPRFEAWLDKYLKEANTVHHANDYDQSVPRHKRDIEHQKYMEELKAHHGR
ncbi:nucleic acid/nucleotide deaminase domain-containing protein [Streptomyces sp. NPDC055134]